MPIEFMVVGENKDDEGELLVKGSDGKYYEYDLTRERFSPVEPDDHWELFPNAQEASDEY
jgi:hypothetical protein